jgi:hypothetical protein
MNVLKRIRLCILELRPDIDLHRTPHMPDLHSLPDNWWPSSAIYNNGPDALLIEILKLRELAEGWSCYNVAYNGAL